MLTLCLTELHACVCFVVVEQYSDTIKYCLVSVKHSQVCMIKAMYNSDCVDQPPYVLSLQSCALYWPEEYGYTVEYGPLSIELLFSSEADANITVRTFKLTHRTKVGCPLKSFLINFE